ncbi:cytochrome P450 [Flagelloscypha sp. PMI_526]|nr:cytochrome P450 [Flagelloscypha sp. PMI_526]
MASETQFLQQPPLVLTLRFIALGSGLVYSFTQRKSRPYPPGPAPLPILGNLKDIDPSKQWVSYEEIGKKFASPVIHATILGTHIISINDFQTARDIFERRGIRHGTRPPLTMLREISGHSWNFGYWPYDAKYKTARKFMDMYLRTSESKKLRPLEQEIMHRVLPRFKETPEAFAHHTRFFAVATMLQVAYGITIHDSHDPFIDIIEHSLEAVNESASYQIVDSIPWLRYLPQWFPGMSWKSKTGPWKEANARMRDIPFDAVESDLKGQQALGDSVAKQLLERQKKEKGGEGLTEEVIEAVTATLVAGGVDTTVSNLLSFILCMKVFPHVQEKAQAELDSTIGSSRLPTFEDKASLPYVSALCKELIRFVSVTPIALPHFADGDDIWVNEGKEYLIPKNSIVLGNVWAMTRDEKTYHDPHTFNPERYLTPDGHPRTDIQDPGDIVFGFRPRHCPGRWMAEDVLFIFVASILATFTVRPEEGQEKVESKVPEFEALWKHGLAIYPRDFKCDMQVRNESLL